MNLPARGAAIAIMLPDRILLNLRITDFTEKMVTGG